MPGSPGVPEPLRARWDPIEDDYSRARTSAGSKSRSAKRRSAVGWFLHRYGWRAYALPVLAALTVVTIVYATQSPTGEAAGPAGGSQITVVNGVTHTLVETQLQTVVQKITETAAPAPTGQTAPIPAKSYGDLSSAMLPPGGAFTASGAGTWHVVPGHTEPVGTGSKRFTYRVQVEDGIGNPEADAAFGTLVDTVLADQRSWIGGGEVSLQRVQDGNADFTIALTSQMTTRTICGFSIPLESSCYNGAKKIVVINDARWQRGAVSYNGDLGLYRVYVINHEVGHFLGFRHEPCRENGSLAPVMMQQSWAVANDDLAPLDRNVPSNGAVCRTNPYPFPTAAAAS